MSMYQTMRLHFFSKFKRTIFASALALSLALPMSIMTASNAEASPSAAKKTTSKVASKGKSSKVASKAKGTKVSKRNSKLRQLARYKRHRFNAADLIPDESKAASLVIDATTGKVVFAKNATELRHPASLTKMMTLYLTFEALEKGKLKWNQMLPVSDIAAEQAPTNLSLEEGDTISVRDAVLGLIVRSANDAAVVLAEAIGGNEPDFAVMMTRKAKALGMNNTVYKNASGLPDERQITTARDLAVLALALRKHYPDNYKLFSTRSFEFHGRDYESHNRVMMRYAGADGLKTGYTRMSGFNLVTSASRYGYKVVAVVMGGVTGKSRDDQMIALLDSSFRQMASASGKTIYASAEEVKQANREVEEGEGDADEEVASTDDSDATTAIAPAAFKEKSSNKTVRSYSLADAGEVDAPKETAVADGKWGIQVGAYELSKDALMAAANAKALAAEPLADSKISITGTDDDASKVHRARLTNLTQGQAQDACKMLISKRESCFVYRVEAEYAQQM